MSEFEDSEFQGKVVVITGAGNGLGRSHAHEFAKRGAQIVVNDLGGAVDGSGAGDAADTVVQEIEALGGTAIANKASVSDKAGAKSIIDDAISAFGRVDILVNNAGILRDKSFKKMTLEEWDLVLQVHLNLTHSYASLICPTPEIGDKVAQVVEHCTENAGVASSTLALGTTDYSDLARRCMPHSSKYPRS